MEGQGFYESFKRMKCTYMIKGYYILKLNKVNNEFVISRYYHL